ncbi:MAG: mechanosensitive ion channel [Natronospirillum sp.]
MELTAFGYYYTALQLTGRFLATFYVLTGWVIAEVVVMRGVELSTARLQLQRDHEAREAQLANPAPTPDGQTINIEPEVKAEVQKVRLQTLRLARFLLLAVFGGLLYWVWADLFTAFGYLDSMVLWEYGGSENPTPMSLADLGSALFIVGITLFLAANLPGLLEMLVLSRLALQQGSAYAITTLMNYIITTIGLVLALSSLGVSWDKLQWLVAALSVGLGFGLQEIFANFVSGLIILFERPVRIGDVVTLGNLSGRVRQIHIRATTITDFDRKDIIVPNKTFVTEQLINWSLTDTVTRVIVHVGVAYGSDLEKTRKILLKAAHLNPRVLKDPEPQVLFLNFGASTLDHELRIHVMELIDRNPAIDEINRYIDKEFNKAGIEIAFQQVDIRLRNSEGIERLIERRDQP